MCASGAPGAPGVQATATRGLILLAGAVGFAGSAAPPSARLDFSGASLGDRPMSGLQNGQLKRMTDTEHYVLL